MQTPRWPAELDRRTISFTFDVEWAPPEVITDVRHLLDEHGVVGTFFVTHKGVEVPGHERAIHPNFRRNGDIYRALPQAGECTDAAVHEHVIATAHGFAPEAIGVRSHSLYFDSSLLPVYAAHGLQYDASVRLELSPHLQPCRKQYGIVEIPTYYCDYYDLIEHATGWEPAPLALDLPGLKVLDFHPNIVYTNAASLDAYEAIRPFYHDVERLLAARSEGPGARALLVALLEEVERRKLPTATLAQINAWWRSFR